MLGARVVRSGGPLATRTPRCGCWTPLPTSRLLTLSRPTAGTVRPGRSWNRVRPSMTSHKERSRLMTEYPITRSPGKLDVTVTRAPAW
jgi:hypothetical protein